MLSYKNMVHCSYDTIPKLRLSNECTADIMLVEIVWARRLRGVHLRTIGSISPEVSEHDFTSLQLPSSIAVRPFGKEGSHFEAIP